ncbi:MAG TPA: Lpg1974 family pore-forming outer membrane protein, partial [Candidatus Babeliaceae bacterium]|nr:Lpg1974 family pore-forming outer membrane protein [Candidatus Babeliaceae bacterium]
MSTKKFFTTTVALTLASSFIIADPYPAEDALTAAASSQMKGKNTVNAELPRQNLPAQDFAPPAGPRAKSPGTLQLGLSFIYWKTSFNNPDFAQGGYIGPSPLITFGQKVPRGKVEILKMKYHPGFKAKTGWIFPNNNWNLFAEYTWLYQPSETAHARDGSHNPNVRASQSATLPLPTAGDGAQGIAPLFVKGKAAWSQHFNALDLMLANNFYLTPTLSVQPLVGLKGLDVKTINTFEYDMVNLGQTFSQFDGSTYFIFTQEKTKGLGPRLGASSLWNFTRNWGLYGQLAFSYLWMYYKEIHTEDLNSVTGINAL